jgi:HEAT repeats
MEITFCERCRESIPDADFESGKAVRVGPRPFHVACAFRHSFPGPGRALVAFLALLAVGAGTYAAVRVGRLDADLRADRAERQAAFQRLDDRLSREGTDVAQHVKGAVAGESTLLRQEQEASLSRFAETLRTDLRTAKEATRVETEKQLAGWADAHHARFSAIEKRLEDLGDWIRDVRDLAKKAPEPAAATPPGPAPAGPSPGSPAVEPAAGPTTAPVDPAEAKRRAAEVDRNIERLKDSSDTVVFSAAMALGELGDLRATAPLVEVLRTHKYYYARLAAASSLGNLQAADAMPALIDALEDKDTLVQTAVAEALSAVTRQPYKNPLGRSKKDLKALKEEWATWWKENEAEVRRRLNQPA